VKDVVGKLTAEGAEVAGQKGNVVLVTVPGEGRNVRIVIRFCKTDSGGGFLDLRARGTDFRVRLESRLVARFALARFLDFRNIRIKCQISRKRKSHDVVELIGQVRELQLRGQQFLSCL